MELITTNLYNLDAEGTNSNKVLNMAKELKAQIPNLEDLTPSQFETLSKMVMAKKLTDNLNRIVDLSGIDYLAEKNNFLENSSRTRSKHTQNAYTRSLTALESFCNSHKIEILTLSHSQADDFINSLRSSGLAPATLLQRIAGCSSFFSWLSRRHDIIRNPFPGSRVLPRHQAVRVCVIPTKKEFYAILKNYNNPTTKLIIMILATCGFRIGALPSLHIIKNSYKAQSKGKEISGILSDDIISEIKKVFPETWKQPFASFNLNSLKKRVENLTTSLFKKGFISGKFSPHDFRHYFAVTHYKKHKDIYKLSKLLHHSSVGITGNYLKSINVYTD